MPNSKENTFDNVQEIRSLIRKQQLLEEELEQLKRTLDMVERTNKEAIGEINNRIDAVEENLAKLSVSIDNVVSSVERVQKTVNNVYKSVGKIESKQDQTIMIQDKFIAQLWKAFFAILAVVTAGASIIFALVK